MLAGVTLDYRLPGPLTDLDSVPAEFLEGVGSEPLAICSPVHTMFVQPTDPLALDLPHVRLADNHIRPAARLAHRLVDLDPRPLNEQRAPGRQVVGTCRHFAVLACALLRYRGVESRVRCGFATYFAHRRAVDHWIIEYRPGNGRRWVRMDPEILGTAIVEHPEDLRQGQFLTGCEAWMAFRRGEVDASRFGVHGTENWGPAEIRGNAVKDLAAVNKVEMLPWDEWGRMTEAYEGKSGRDYDSLLDKVAEACTIDDPMAIADVYEHPDLRVPDSMVG